jgi:hypothetical protein
MICASPSASFRSVLLNCMRSAARACRASRQITSRPASVAHERAMASWDQFRCRHSHSRQHAAEQLFYSFRLEEAVPDDHLVRAIAAVIDLSWVHAELATYYPKIGRPSIDPALMIRMLVVGYIFAIRSERALCREVQVNLAYRWFCGLSIEDKVPDHSAFSRAQRAVWRRRYLPERIRACCGRVHRCWSGRRRRICGGCQSDCCRRQ